MADRPQLRLIVDAETGELVDRDERDILIDQLQAEKKGQSLQIGKLKRELKELRAVEPEHETIRDVLAYWQHRCAPKTTLAIGGKRWEKVRARLKDNLIGRDPWTPDELKLAVDGALLDPWLSGRDPHSKGYLDAETIFRDPEMVAKLCALALGFEAKAGVGLGELLEVSAELAMVDWKFLLRVCSCGHRRLSHSKPDPNRDGWECCLATSCWCLDFTLDPDDPFNLSVDEHLRYWADKDNWKEIE